MLTGRRPSQEELAIVDTTRIEGSNRGRLARSLQLAAAILACFTGCLTGCKPKTNVYAPPPPPEVTVAHPQRKSVTRFLEYSGTTEAYETVDLRARVSGFLDHVYFKPGATVKSGELLFVIDPRPYEAQVQQAEADAASRKAALQLADITLERTTLAAKSSAANPQELDRAVAERDQARAQLQLAEAAVVTARLNLEFTQVQSPIDGRITKNFVDVGNLVGAGGQPTVLATIVNPRPIYVTVNVNEADTLAVRRARLARQPEAEPGQIAPGEWRPADLATADSGEFNVHGRIDYVDPALDPQSGTIRVRCRFENEDGVLLPGLFVRVRVLLESVEETVAPDIALLSDQSGRYALVVNDQDTVEQRRVKVGALDGQMRVVAEGLNASDRVIVNGLQRARPGAKVKPTLQEAPGQGPTGPTGAQGGPHV
jgi:RND family efflux transporter MFP subunit